MEWTSQVVKDLKDDHRKLREERKPKGRSKKGVDSGEDEEAELDNEMHRMQRAMEEVYDKIRRAST